MRPVNPPPMPSLPHIGSSLREIGCELPNGSFCPAKVYGDTPDCAACPWRERAVYGSHIPHRGLQHRRHRQLLDKHRKKLQEEGWSGDDIREEIRRFHIGLAFYSVYKDDLREIDEETEKLRAFYGDSTAIQKHATCQKCGVTLQRRSPAYRAFQWLAFVILAPFFLVVGISFLAMFTARMAWKIGQLPEPEPRSNVTPCGPLCRYALWKGAPWLDYYCRANKDTLCGSVARSAFRRDSDPANCTMFKPSLQPKKRSRGSTTIPTTDVHVEDIGQATVVEFIHDAIEREKKLWERGEPE